MSERLVWNPRALRDLEKDPEVQAALLRAGEHVAEKAREMAPKRSGEGAASIRAEVVDGEVRVSWDQDHFYMAFAELGTEKQSATPFLRPAADDL